MIKTKKGEEEPMSIKSWEGAEGLEVDTDYDLVLRADC